MGMLLRKFFFGQNSVRPYQNSLGAFCAVLPFLVAHAHAQVNACNSDQPSQRDSVPIFVDEPTFYLGSDRKEYLSYGDQFDICLTCNESLRNGVFSKDRNSAQHFFGDLKLRADVGSPLREGIRFNFSKFGQKILQFQVKFGHHWMLKTSQLLNGSKIKSNNPLKVHYSPGDGFIHHFDSDKISKAEVDFLQIDFPNLQSKKISLSLNASTFITTFSHDHGFTSTGESVRSFSSFADFSRFLNNPSDSVDHGLMIRLSNE